MRKSDHNKVLKMTNGKKPRNSVRLDRCPEYDDARALLEIGIAAMVRLSRCGDPAVAREAAQWLAEYEERLRKSERQAEEETASGVSPGGSGQFRVC